MGFGRRAIAASPSSNRLPAGFSLSAEVQGQEYELVVEEVESFCDYFHSNRFLITCRTQNQRYKFEGFTDVEVADFKPEQVNRFIKRWFAVVVDNAESDNLALELIGQLQQPKNKQIAELAVTPVLLNLICFVFQGERGNLPKNRADLYKKGLRDLLEGLDESKVGVQREPACEELTPEAKEKMLAYLAATLFEANDYFTEQETLEKLIIEHLDISPSKAIKILKSVEEQSGLIVERSEGFWSFSHLTFQEYFTAEWFCDRAARDGWGNLVKHITKTRWREVFLLAVEMAKSPDSADELLILMKKEVDASITLDPYLIDFFTWIKNQSASLQDSFLPALRRISYLLLSDAFVPNSIFIEALKGESSLNDESQSTLENAIGDFIQLETNFTYILTSAHSFRMINGSYSLMIELCFWLVFNLDIKIQEIVEQLLEGFLDENKKTFQRCVSKAESWIEKLRAIMFDYRNTAYQWKFSQQQKEVLKQYYDTNLFLVECLNSACTLRDEVSEKIKETLFLPIPEIEKRQQQM